MLQLVPEDRKPVYDKYARWLMGLEWDTKALGVNTSGLTYPDEQRAGLLEMVAKDFQRWPDDPLFLLLRRLFESPDFLSYVEPYTYS